MARVLSEATKKPIGHEELFTNVGFRDALAKKYVGDSSWLAMPYLPVLDAFIIHVVRHPLKVIASLKGIGFFAQPTVHGEYLQWARRWTPGIDSVSAQDKEAWFYFIWNSMIEPWADIRVRVEDMDVKRIYKLVKLAGLETTEGYVERVNRVSRKYNTRPHGDLTWANIQQPYRELVRHMAKEYGYGV